MKAEINERRDGREQMMRKNVARRQKGRCTEGSRDEGLTNGQRKLGRLGENSSGTDGSDEAQEDDSMDR